MNDYGDGINLIEIGHPYNSKNIQNNNLLGQYSNYRDKYQQYKTVNTSENIRPFRFDIPKDEFNDFY